MKIEHFTRMDQLKDFLRTLFYQHKNFKVSYKKLWIAPEVYVDMWTVIWE